MLTVAGVALISQEDAFTETFHFSLAVTFTWLFLMVISNGYKGI